MTELILQKQVETLYQQAAASQQEFCIDLEGEAPDGRPVWEWMDYSTKGNAVRTLSGLIENEDYQLSEVISGRGGTPRQIIRFSRVGFKRWGMLARTERGRQIRDYYIECEKRLQLGMSQPTTMNAALEKILERQMSLTEDLSFMIIHGINGVRADIGDVRVELGDVRERVARLEEQQCDQLYVFVRSKDLTIKLGYTTDLAQRRKQHERKGFVLIGAVPGTHKRESQIKKSLKHRGFLPKNGTEEFQLCPEIVEAFIHEGLPIGDLSCTPPKTAWDCKNKKKAARANDLTPPLF